MPFSPRGSWGIFDSFWGGQDSTYWSKDQEFYEDVEVYDNPEVLEILPPMQGFFFGSYEIDDNYKQDIVNTIEVLEQELSLPDVGYAFYEYHASW